MKQNALLNKMNDKKNEDKRQRMLEMGSKTLKEQNMLCATWIDNI